MHDARRFLFRRCFIRPLACCFVVASAGLAVISEPTHGETVQFVRPDLDQWFYPANTTPGTRVLGPTFSFIDSPGTSMDPARRGATMVAFNTSSKLPVNLVPARYQVNSVTLTFTNAVGNGNLTYDPSFDPVSDILGDTDDPGHPIELFGVGFRSDYENPYTTLGFGTSDSRAPEFEEGTSLYSSGTGAYDLFPLGDDGQGRMTDVYNSPSGGYNAVTGESDSPAWDAVPWAIGTVPGLAPGDEVPFNSRFEFSVDLTQSPIVEYVQKSLSEGGIGFFFSSLHRPDGHEGDVVYPQWYMREYPGGEPASLVMDVTILPEFAAGDFDGDQELNEHDLELMTEVIVGGTSSSTYDVNSDGANDTRDLEFWITNLKRTWIGDANLDGEFTSGDLVLALQAGKYETDQRALWSEGDWNGDLRFNTSDLVAALQAGGYDSGRRAIPVSVPEPTGISLVMGTLLMLRTVRERRDFLA